MSSDLQAQAPEPSVVGFAQEQVPTMANQNMPSDQQQERRDLEREEEDVIEEGWIDGRRSSRRIQDMQRRREEHNMRAGPSGLQNPQADFSTYRTSIHHEEMTSSDESNKRKIEAFNLDDLTSDLTDTDTSELRSKTPTSPKISRALRQLDIAQKSPTKRRQGKLFAHINRLTFEEEEILRSTRMLLGRMSWDKVSCLG